MQVIFAGKAHPRDEAGKEFLRAVSRSSRMPEFLGRVVLLPDYDMGLARRLPRLGLRRLAEQPDSSARGLGTLRA